MYQENNIESVSPGNEGYEVETLPKPKELEVSAESQLKTQTEHSVKRQIRDLEKQIKETNLDHERISRFQSAYSVPDEALTDLDRAVKDVQVSKLEEKLDVLKKQTVHQTPKWRQSLRKIATFFSF